MEIQGKIDQIILRYAGDYSNKMIKLTDELTRNLRKNVFINKIKDVTSFIDLINNIFRCMLGKLNLNNFFYRFDRSLAIEVIKKEDDTYDYVLHLKGIKSGEQVFMEDLYALLYIFFVNFKVLNVSRTTELSTVYVTLNIKFSVKENNMILVKETLKRIKELKALLESMRIRYAQNRERKEREKPVEDIFITK